MNVLLQSVNALLVWSLLMRLRLPGAWFAAAIFALHPVHVESVAWVTELKNLLSLLFSLASLWFWVRFLESGKPFASRLYGLSLLLYLPALLSKATACTLPAALLPRGGSTAPPAGAGARREPLGRPKGLASR